MAESDTPEVPANDIPAILARANAAIAGPWKTCGASDGNCVCGLVWSIPADVPIAQGLVASRDEDGLTPEGRRAVIDFIAYSRTDVPNMAAEILSLRADRKRLDVLEEILKAGKVISGKVTIEVHEGHWIHYPTFREAADAELSRREKENG